MSIEQLYRIKVQAGLCLQPSILGVRLLPLSPPPSGGTRLGPHVPNEIPLDLVPLDLQPLGSTFWMLFNARLEVIGVERLEDVNPES